MSFFSSIGDFFKKLFGGNGNTVETVITDIEVLYEKAVPIVSAFSAVITAEDKLNPSVAMEKVVGVLNTFVTDGAAVDNWLKANQGLGLVNLLQNAAVFALSFTSNSTVVKDLQLAVQLAFNVFAALNPQITGTATVQQLGKAPVKPAA